jgi:uncharacterized membrane protein YjjP (DUF1212 family)
MESRRAELDLLAHAGRLLLQYNESTAEIQRILASTAGALTRDGIDIAVSYSGIAVSLGGDKPLRLSVSEIRYNNSVLTRIHLLLEQVRSNAIEVRDALDQLLRVEDEVRRQPAWLVALALAAGAASLAILLGADAVAAVTTAVSTAAGFVVRQVLHRRHARLLTLPLAAALVGGVLSGIAIRLGVTETPGLALIVPCLMLVPGPHLINGLLDLVENYIPMSIARLALATAILLSSSLGLLIGVELTLPDLPKLASALRIGQLHLIADAALAAVVTNGFAVYYNTAWRQVGLAIVGGAFGHGLRTLALSGGWTLEAATFLGGFTVGMIAGWIARSHKTPFAAIAFAGAVTMLPGLQMYAAIRGAIQLARMQGEADSAALGASLTNGLQSAIVVAALGLGLIIAATAIRAFPQRTTSQLSRR